MKYQFISFASCDQVLGERENASLDLSKSPFFSSYAPEPWTSAYAPIEEVTDFWHALTGLSVRRASASWLLECGERSLGFMPSLGDTSLELIMKSKLIALQASTPPSSWYLSPQVADLEKIAIFHNNWLVSVI
jgi:hypothetical protein